MPYHDVLEQYLDFIYGTRHSLFVPQFRAEAVKKYGLYFQENCAAVLCTPSACFPCPSPRDR